jgi:hypothetical protein
MLSFFLLLTPTFIIEPKNLMIRGTSFLKCLKMRLRIVVNYTKCGSIRGET